MEKAVKKKNRRFSREFKIAAVKRVLAGEPLGKVARELDLKFDVLWTWKKRVVEQGEHSLYDVGRRRGAYQKQPSSEGQERRIAELEALVNKVVFEG